MLIISERMRVQNRDMFFYYLKKSPRELYVLVYPQNMVKGIFLVVLLQQLAHKRVAIWCNLIHATMYYVVRKYILYVEDLVTNKKCGKIGHSLEGFRPMPFHNLMLFVVLSLFSVGSTNAGRKYSASVGGTCCKRVKTTNNVKS